LNDYIRDHLNLKGYKINLSLLINKRIHLCLIKRTKVTCNEGGCGVCIINGVYKDVLTNETKSVSINSVN
jgi:hypothetical protein